jgi:beta-lactamase regulating signal transducer with metallopeptidase domain
LLVVLALLALLTIGFGIRRAVRACIAASAFLRQCGPVQHRPVVTGEHVDIVDVPEPIVAVVGGWRPTIVASANVFLSCSDEEFCQVVAHEAAHVSAYDNFKLFLLVLCPDALAWLPAGAALAARWRAAAEREADERAAGGNRRKRLALASALIKVARLSICASQPLPSLSMPIAVDDVEGRVRGLLAPSLPARRSKLLWGLAAALWVVPVIGMPLYGLVHQWIEALVAFGH